MELKHLKPKQEFKFSGEPTKDLLDWFPNPGVNRVSLFCREFTSLCPVTGQPDYGTVFIEYVPNERCVESKSLKLYLGQFRMYGSFCETLANRIAQDLFDILQPKYLKVIVRHTFRGGISIQAKKEVKG